MADFITITPRQKYLNLREIFDAYGSRAVVAYKCRTLGGVPQGGYVVAVEAAETQGPSKLKEYLRQFAKRFPDKEPVFFMRLREKDASSVTVSFIGSGAPIKEPPLEAKEAPLRALPDEALAGAVRTGLKR